jgi:maleate cis-trans isomerase
VWEDVVPKRKLGIISPLSIIDASAYEFYQLAPPGVMAVMSGLGLTEFSAQDVERVFAPLDALADAMMDRGIDAIVQSGAPLPLLIGLEAHDRIVAQLARRTGKPATSTMLAIGAAAQHLGVRRIAVANKWSDAMNGVLAQFFARAGVEVVGVVSELKVPSEYTKMGLPEYLDIAYRFGHEAFAEHPEAEAIYLGGGAGLMQPALELLEREFGKPVISNQNAMLWQTLHLVDFWTPIAGRGLLLAS